MIEERVRTLLEKIYFHELDHRERINARMQLPFAITVALLGGYGFLVSQTKVENMTHLFGWLYCLLGLASFVFFCIGSWKFKEAWLDHEYQVLPPGTELLTHQHTLIDHYRGAGYGKSQAEREFRNVEAKYFADCAADNFTVNEQRSLCLHKANKALLYSGYFLILSIIVSMAITLSSKDDTKSLGTTNILLNRIDNEMTNDPRPPPPPPPPPPPTRIIREGIAPPKPTPPPSSPSKK